MIIIARAKNEEVAKRVIKFKAMKITRSELISIYQKIIHSNDMEIKKTIKKKQIILSFIVAWTNVNWQKFGRKTVFTRIKSMIPQFFDQ